MTEKKIVVLISGTGSNLQAIINATEDSYINATISAVISNRANVLGLSRAQRHKIPTHTIEHTSFDNRELFDHSLLNCIEQYQPDLVILAGFLRILSTPFVIHFQNRMLNIHPSLLPKYPGLNTHLQALEAGDKYHGSSVHFVIPELDSGPIIIQSKLEIAETNLPTDKATRQLASQILEQEHIIYPLAIKWFVEERLKLGQNGVELDGRLLNTPVQLQAVTEKLRQPI